MKLIDANTVNDILSQSIPLKDEYLLAPDVVDEVDLTVVTLGKPLPDEIVALDTKHVFERSIYLQKYKRMLNSIGGRSFFNMTGLGDISILAATHMLLKVFEAQRNEQLFDPTEPIEIYTRDGGLIKRIGSEFQSADVSIGNTKML